MGDTFAGFLLGTTLAVVGMCLLVGNITGHMKDAYGKQYCEPVCGNDKYLVQYNGVNELKPWQCVCQVVAP